MSSCFGMDDVHGRKLVCLFSGSRCIDYDHDVNASRRIDMPGSHKG